MKPECPNEYEYTISFARELIAYLGGDASLINDNDCWGDVIWKFPELHEAAMEYFQQATTGAPAIAMYYLVKYGGAHRELAERAIERCSYPEIIAFYMVRDCGSAREWAEAIIERATGFPVFAAKCMMFYCGSSLEWCQTICDLQQKRKNNELR